MKSSLFYGGHYAEVATAIRDYLNSVPDYLSEQTSRSTRAAGDAIETLIADQFDRFLGEWCKEYSANFARRAMADVAFTDKEDFYCIVDVKTHREDTRFNMPNLTSVERLSRFYEDDQNIFALLLVKYAVDGNRVVVSEVNFGPIEFLDWDCLTIGALGWGQIQIANSNHIQIRHGYSRKAWMLELCECVLEFYPREIAKIRERIHHFERLQTAWHQRVDSWA